MLGTEAYNIIVTGQRVIFAIFTTDMATKAAKEAAKGKGFLTGMLYAATSGFDYYKKYLSMPPEAALKENPHNFAIEISRIRSVKLEAGRIHDESLTRNSLDFHDNNRMVTHRVYDDSKLQIDVGGEKYSFDVPAKHHNIALDTIRKAGLQ